MKPMQYPLAAQSAGSVPLRRAGSIRRTISIDVRWPDGFGGSMLMQGAGRDFLTGAEGDGQIIDAAAFALTLSANRTVLAAESDAVPELATLIGARAGGASRKIVAQICDGLAGRLIFQLLDDFAGASLVAGWAWSNWIVDWDERARLFAAAATDDPTSPMVRDMTDICVGFAEGGSSLQSDGTVNHQAQSRAAAAPLTRADDALAWHILPQHSGPSFRRARWIDLWFDEGALAFEGGFQDSSTAPDGGRVAVHEYRIAGRLADDGQHLAALDVYPQVLPYRECPGAAPKAAALIGGNVEDFRQQVIVTLRGINGCTHLNDMLRALSDLVYLSGKLST